MPHLAWATRASRSRLLESVVENVSAFLAAGYTQQSVLEVVLGVGMKTLSNYTNHLAETPLDDAFAPARWERPTATTA